MRRRVRAAGSIVAVALTAALAVGLISGVPAGAAAQSVAGATPPASDIASAPPEAVFWLALGDTTLVRLIGVALESSPLIEAADARVGSARAERLEAGLDLAPAITATGSFSRQRMASAAFPGAGLGAGGSLPDQELWEAGVHLSWEVDAFGRLRNALQGRGALLDAAEEGVDDARLILSAEVAAAYYRLRGEEDRLAVARRNAENQRRTLAVTEERLAAGRGTALDTERARAQLSSTLAIISGLEASMAAAENRIAALLGGHPGPLLDAGSAATLALPEAPPVPEPDELARRRPDLRAAERQVEASQAFAGAARSAYLPRLAIQGAAGYTAGAFDALGSSGTPRYLVGPVVSWPLLDLGRVKARVDGARAREVEARARYRDARLRAEEEVETARTGYDRARQRLRHLEDAAAASERATGLARLRFEEGATGFLEVLDAERRQLEAQDRLAVGRTEAATALVALYRAVGGELPSS